MPYDVFGDERKTQPEAIRIAQRCVSIYPFIRDKCTPQANIELTSLSGMNLQEVRRRWLSCHVPTTMNDTKHLQRVCSTLLCSTVNKGRVTLFSCVEHRNLSFNLKPEYSVALYPVTSAMHAEAPHSTYDAVLPPWWWHVGRRRLRKILPQIQRRWGV